MCEQVSQVVTGLKAREMSVLVGCSGAMLAEGILVGIAFAAARPPSTPPSSPWLSPDGSCLDIGSESMVSLVFPCSDV